MPVMPKNKPHINPNIDSIKNLLIYINNITLLNILFFATILTILFLRETSGSFTINTAFVFS